MKIEKQVKKTVKTALISVAIGLLLGTLIVLAATPSGPMYIGSGVYPGAPSYMVWREGSNYFAKDANGQIDYSGTNASQIIINCFDALSQNGGKIFFKNGVYNLLTPLSYHVQSGTGGYIDIEGESRHGTSLDGESLSDYALQLHSPIGVGRISVSNIRIEGGVSVYNGSQFYFENVYFCNSGVDRYLLNITDSCIIRIRNCVFRGGDAGGLLMYGTNEMNGCSDIFVTNNLFYDCNNFLIRLKGSSTTTYVRDITIADNYLEPYSTSPSHGVELYNCRWIRLIGNTIAGVTSASHDLVRIDGDGGVNSYHIKLIGNDIWQTNPNRYGVYLGACAYYTEIHNNYISGQTKGLYINSSTTGSRITYNILTSIQNDAAGLGGGNIFEGNSGYVTENGGTTGAIASGATVNHSLAGTPTSVIITPAETGLTDIHVSAKAATTFTITYTGGGTHVFYWSAEYQP